MVYTIERLNHALSVFRESESSRVKGGLKAANLEDKFVKYNLRKVATNFRKRAELWQNDEDSEDGEYDPSQKKRSSLQLPTKPRRRRKQIIGVEEQDGGAGTSQKTAVKQIGCFGITAGQLTLHLKSERGRMKLQELAAIHGTGFSLPIGASDNPELLPLRESGSNRLSDDLALKAAELTARFKRVEQHYLDAEERVLEERGHNLRNRTVEVPREEKNRISDQVCNIEKRGCSLKSLAKKTPCSYYKKANMRCVTRSAESEDEDPGKGQPARKDKSNQTIKTTFSKFATSTKNPYRDTNRTMITIDDPRSPTPESTQNQAGVTRFITTNWAHPMNLKHNPKPNLLSSSIHSPCHFCNDYRYGIFGCGRVVVEVFQHPGTHEYEETGRGNRARGREATRMCGMCALDRLHTSNCSKHKMARFTESPRLPKLDFQRWMNDLHDRSEYRSMKITYPCCSFCRSPAAFACCTGVNNIEVTGIWKTAKRISKKCSLLLCSECNVSLKHHGMQLEKLEGDIEKRMVKPRADMEFLFPGSDLQKAWGV